MPVTTVNKCCAVVLGTGTGFIFGTLGLLGGPVVASAVGVYTGAATTALILDACDE